MKPKTKNKKRNTVENGIPFFYALFRYLPRFKDLGRRMGAFYLVAMLSCSIAYGKDYSNEQIANAIRRTEGTWTYGIKTASCSDEKECRRICLNTIRNNRIRYAKYGYRKYPHFIEFLQSRYCPTASRNLSKSEKRLNKYWLSNLKWFLEHPKRSV